MKCPVCGSDKIKDFLKKGDIKTFRCLFCDTVFQDFAAVADKLSAIYGKEYYEPWGLENDNLSNSARAVKEKTFEKKLATIMKYKTGGKILDIGCANGSFLSVAQKKGFDVHGSDINPHAIKLAKEKFGDSIFEGEIGQFVHNKMVFSVVTMFDVLEHMSDPVKALAEINSILEQGGFIVLVTPNWRSFSAKTFRSGWMNFKLEHIYYFSPKSIQYLLKKAGFEVIFTQPNTKELNLSYINTQVKAYDNGIISKLLPLILSWLPGRLKDITFPLYTGEIFTIAKKQ